MKVLPKIFLFYSLGVFFILVCSFSLVYFFTYNALHEITPAGNIVYPEILIEAKAQENAFRVTAVLAPFILLFYLVIMIILSRFFISIENIVKTSKKIAGGDLNKRFEIISSDESGELAKAFNDMTDRLRELYIGLDKLVRDRTAILVVRVRELEYEKAEVEAILESIGDGMIAVSSSGRIMLMNDFGKNLLHLQDDKIIGKEFYENISEQDNQGVDVPEGKRSILKALKGERVITKIDLKNIIYFVRPDGSKFPVSITCAPIRLQNEVIGAIGIFNDITHELQVDKMKTEFIFLASHQLRTPLSAIKWFSEMLLAGDAGKLSKEQEEFTSNIAISTERMIDLVRGLLNISRMESGRIMIDPKPTNISEMVKNVLGELQNQINEKSLKLTVNIHENLPDINIDPKLIRQVYLNLLTNAVKYTPKNGEITINIKEKDNTLNSQITDTGYGIPKEQQDRVYQKFFRADNILKFETNGTGLGLYLAKEIVEASGGKIWFDSVEGKGTTFWFSLPLDGSQSKIGEVVLD